MNRTLVFVVAVVVGGVATGLFVSAQLKSRHAAALAAQRAALEQTVAELEAALESAKGVERVVAVPAKAPALAPAPTSPQKPTAAELVARLRALKSTPENRTRTVRQLIYLTEELIALGPEALPAMREFLARNEDVEFDSYSRGVVPGDFVTPPSLRFALFDAARRIGGPDAEKLLAEVLGVTGRGVEVSWLARTLQEIAPDKYRDVALTAARELLTRGAAANPASPLDRGERENLFGVLTMYGDTSYVGTAQAQLLRPDGNVDRSALKYLQQSLGQQSVPLAAQWYDDPRFSDPDKKEPFARLALNYVGADAQADAFYQKAINDFTLTKEHRKDLIEDLNQDGFPNKRNLSASDLPLIQNRIALIEHLAPQATDPVNAAAFKEAYKDLVNMRERALRPPTPRP